MKKPFIFLFALLFVLAFEGPSRTQEPAAALAGLKQEATVEVEDGEVCAGAEEVLLRSDALQDLPGTTRHTISDRQEVG